MAISQFRNLSNWERHDITIKPNELYTLNFINATPNYFVVTNPNMARLKIGISSLPRENSFEFKVEYNTTETLGRPHGTNNLYILNDSSIEVSIIVFSATHEFDPEILKNLNVGLEGYIIQTSTEIEGVQEGVTLPVQDRDLSDFMNKLLSNNTNPAYMNLAGLLVPIKNMIAENKVNGYTNLATLSERLGNLTDLANILLHGATNEGRTNLYDLLYQLSDISRELKKWKESKFYTAKESDINITHDSPAENMYRINHLTNDGETDISLSISKNGVNNVITLKGGETVDNIVIETENKSAYFSISPANQGETISYRLLAEYV